MFKQKEAAAPPVSLDHSTHAAMARKVLSQPLPAGTPLQMREMQLAQANAHATLALYELLKCRNA